MLEIRIRTRKFPCVKDLHGLKRDYVLSIRGFLSAQRIFVIQLLLRCKNSKAEYWDYGFAKIRSCFIDCNYNLWE